MSGTTGETLARLLPFYLVVDVSLSMEQDGKLESANEILPNLVDALAQNPIISDKVRFGVIDFSDDAQVLLPLCDLLEQAQLPGLTARAGTSYAAAFRMLKDRIERDVAQLKADGFQVHRPAAFFLSDGEPTDPEPEWRDAYKSLTEYDSASGTGFRMYPNLIPFGVKGADPKLLQQLIHPSTGHKPMQMYLMDQDQSAGEAIRKMAEVLISSVINSGAGLAEGSTGIALPPADALPTGVSAFGPDDDIFM